MNLRKTPKGKGARSVSCFHDSANVFKLMNKRAERANRANRPPRPCSITRYIKCFHFNSHRVLCNGC